MKTEKETIPEGITRMGKDYCPNCEHLLDSASAAFGKHVPKPHDVTVCFYCAVILEFSDDMALVKLPWKTYNKLDQETQLQLGNIYKFTIYGN